MNEIILDGGSTVMRPVVFVRSFVLFPFWKSLCILQQGRREGSGKEHYQFAQRELVFLEGV